jgi:hypothetical protein
LQGLIVLSAAVAAHAHLQPNSLSPASGALKIGDEVTVSWNEEVHHAGTTDVTLSIDGGKTWTVDIKKNFVDAEGDNSVKWTVPSEAATTEGKIRVCQKAGSTCTDAMNVSRPGSTAPYVLVSGALTVSDGTFVLAPQGVSGASLRFDAASRNLEVSLDLKSRERVVLEAFDPSGRLLATLLDGAQEPGVRRLSVFSSRLDAAAPIVFKLRVGARMQVQAWEGVR